MKQKWIRPQTTIEKFVPDEYIAACWGVRCDTDWSNNYEKRQGDYSKGVTHDAAHCGNPRNQVIYDSNDDGIADRMIETGTDGLGNLNCTIYWDESFSGIRDIASVKPDDIIYWTTRASDGREWNHKGTVFKTNYDRPNHS